MLIYVLPFWLLLPMIVAAAFIWGAAPERAGATAFAVAALASLLPSMRAEGWLGVQWWLLGIDLLLVAGLVVLLFRFGLWWIAAALACQVISVFAHLARMLDAAFDPVAYALMEGASSYPTVAILAYAVARRAHSSRATSRDGGQRSRLVRR